jgi:hypothetical protein
MGGLWLTLALSATLAAAGPEPAPATPTLLFLLGGQSNMVGQGLLTRLPRTYRPMPDSVSTWDYDGWHKLTPQGQLFGPEFSFAFELARAFPNERIGLIKYARNGSAIAEWSPIDPQSLYAGLMDRHKAAKAASPGSRTVAMLWLQGERDARFGEMAASYPVKLRELIDATRKDTETPELAFFIGQVNPSSVTHPFISQVRRAQVELAKEMKNVVCVTTRGLPKDTDNLHYDAAGCVAMGKRYARAYLDLTAPGVIAAMKPPPVALPTLSPDADPLARGSTWAGARTFAPDNTANEPWRFKVTSREGTKFRGEIRLTRGPGTESTYKVEGTGPTRGEGPVNFTTESKGLFRQHYQGQLADEELILTFDGTAFQNGSPVSGQASLRPLD